MDGNAFQTAVNATTVEAHPGKTVNLVGYVRGNPPRDLYMGWFRVIDTHNESVGDGANLAYVVPRDAQIGDVIVLYFHAASPSTRRESDTIVDITVVESPLSVDAGPDRTATWGDTVTLTATVGDAVAPVNHQWFQAHYPLLEATGESTANLTFTVPDTAPAGTVYEFGAVVSDATGASVRDSVNVEVSARSQSQQVAPLSVNAGSDRQASAGDAVNLSATASGGTAPLTYQWTQTGGSRVTVPSANTANISFVVPDDAVGGTTYSFKVVATDSTGATAEDYVSVGVAPTTQGGQTNPPATGQSPTPLPQDLLDLIRLLLGQTGGAMNITAASDGTITIIIPPDN